MKQQSSREKSATGRSSKLVSQARVMALIRWYRANARDLPWRRNLDPYAIWISEIMLQQTQVTTVTPYWERWMREFPTIEALANASEERVLKCWAGLGYYSRGRNLRFASQQIVLQHRGKLPFSVDVLQSLPGIGRYTAGAIASIAFNQAAPIVDGNVIRVLTRWEMLSGDPRKPPLNSQLWQMAQELVLLAERQQTSAERRCSHLNQGLMELGATVCLPRQPKCTRCPVSNSCKSFQGGTVESFPSKQERPKITERHFAVVLLERNGRWWIRQRTVDEVNAEFWEFPNREFDGKASPSFNKTAVAALNARDCIATWLKIPVERLQGKPMVRHAITRYKMHQWPFSISEEPIHPKLLGNGRWASIEEIRRMPFTSSHVKILSALRPTH